MTTKTYLHMSYQGTFLPTTFTSKAAAMRDAATWMRKPEREREFLMVVCRTTGLPGSEGRPKDSIVWRPF